MAEERVQKILARAGYGSRRASEELITSGRVKINGQVAVLGSRADPNKDTITVDNQQIAREQEPVYIALNKPTGILSEVSPDEPRQTVRDLVPVPGHMFIVGRLDMESEGLILLTNDGELANKLTHPRYGHEKEYRVLVGVRPDSKQLDAWKHGVVLEDGYRTAPAFVRLESVAGKGAWLRVILREGRKRQIREMGRQTGVPVLRILRIRIGSLMLGELKPGEWRHLKPEEVRTLETSKPQGETPYHASQGRRLGVGRPAIRRDGPYRPAGDRPVGAGPRGQRLTEIRPARRDDGPRGSFRRDEGEGSRFGREERPGREDRAGRTGSTGRTGSAGREDRPGRGERIGRGTEDRAGRTGSTGREDRVGREDRPNRFERGGRSGGPGREDRPGGAGRPAGAGREGFARRSEEDTPSRGPASRTGRPGGGAGRPSGSGRTGGTGRPSTGRAGNTGRTGATRPASRRPSGSGGPRTPRPDNDRTSGDRRPTGRPARSPRGPRKER